METNSSAQLRTQKRWAMFSKKKRRLFAAPVNRLFFLYFFISIFHIFFPSVTFSRRSKRRYRLALRDINCFHSCAFSIHFTRPARSAFRRGRNLRILFSSAGEKNVADGSKAALWRTRPVKFVPRGFYTREVI